MAKLKKLTGTALQALTTLCCFSFAVAGNAHGTSAFQFLQLGVGARPAALGEAFAGVSQDVNALYWNPAGLAGIKRGELSMTHALWFENITYSNIAYCQPALGGTIGGALNVLNTGDIQKADNTGARLAENFSMADIMGILSYARSWSKLALGGSLKLLSSRIEEESAHAYAADVGALYSGFRLWGRKLGLGFSVQNAGTKAVYVSERTSLPVTLRAGGALAVLKDLLVTTDVVYKEKDIGLHAGAEYKYAPGALELALRAGYKDDTVGELGMLSGLTAGIGIKWTGYQLDYAWNSFADLGVAHRISVGIRFGGEDVKVKPMAAAGTSVSVADIFGFDKSTGDSL